MTVVFAGITYERHITKGHHTVFQDTQESLTKEWYAQQVQRITTPVEEAPGFTNAEPVPNGMRRVQFTHHGKEYTVDVPASLTDDEVRAMLKQQVTKWFQGKDR